MKGGNEESGDVTDADEAAAYRQTGDLWLVSRLR